MAARVPQAFARLFPPWRTFSAFTTTRPPLCGSPISRPLLAGDSQGHHLWTPAGRWPLLRSPFQKLVRASFPPYFHQSWGGGHALSLARGAPPDCVHAGCAQGPWGPLFTQKSQLCPWPSCSREAGGWRRPEDNGETEFPGTRGVNKVLQAPGPPRAWSFTATSDIQYSPGTGTAGGTRGSTTHGRYHKPCTSPRTHTAVCMPAHPCAQPVRRHARACLVHMYTRTHVHQHACSRLCTAHGARRVWRATGDRGSSWAARDRTRRGSGGTGSRAAGAAQDGSGATGRGGGGRGGRGGQDGEPARAPSPGRPRQRAALRPPPPQPRASRRCPELETSTGAGSGPPRTRFRRRGRAGWPGAGGEGGTRGPLPGPPSAWPRGRVSAGADLPRDLVGSYAADPACCGPSTLDPGTRAWAGRAPRA